MWEKKQLVCIHNVNICPDEVVCLTLSLHVRSSLDTQKSCYEPINLFLFGAQVITCTTMCVYLEGSDSRGVMVNSGGQQALPPLRVVFVGQLAGPQFYIQHPIPGEDGPEVEKERDCPLNQLTKSIHEMRASPIDVMKRKRSTLVIWTHSLHLCMRLNEWCLGVCAYLRCCVSLLRSTESSQ